MKTTMLLATLVATLLTFLTPALAAPEPKAEAKPRRFQIQAKRVGGHQPDFDGLYLSYSHTGAGFNAPIFFKKSQYTPSYYLNETRLMTGIGKEPYGLDFVGGTDYYIKWGATQINIGYGLKGLSISDKGIVYDGKRESWKGWLACKWWHGEPELFWSIYPKPTAENTPANCAIVELIPKYV